MNQSEKESTLKFQPVYPSDINRGLTFHQSLILNLSRNPDITNKKDQSAGATARHINDVADRIIEEMTREGGNVADRIMEEMTREGGK